MQNQTTGIETIENKTLSVYPNPVSSEGIQTNIVDDYIVVNAMGQEIASYKNTQFISTDQLAKGMYLLVAVKTNKRVSFIVE